MTKDECLAKLKGWLVEFKKVTPFPDNAHLHLANRAFCGLSRTLLPAMVRLGVAELEKHKPVVDKAYGSWRCDGCGNLLADADDTPPSCSHVAAWIKVVELVGGGK